MAKRRLIPKLQMKLRKIGNADQLVLVTTVNFDKVSEIGDPVSQARIYEAQAADELIFLNLDRGGPIGENEAFLQVIRKAAEQIFMPFTVGGSVKSLSDFRLLLSNGADKVSVCSAGIESPLLINEASKAFGAQCVVLSIDYRKDPNGRYRVWTNGGTVSTDWDPVAWAVEGEKLGAGEILLTSIDRDGTRSGLDTDLTCRVAERVSIPLITSGGCGLANHFIEGFLIGKADAVSAGTYFSFKDENPMQTRSQIRNAGIPIRIIT